MRLLLPKDRGKGEIRQPTGRRCPPRVRPKGNDPNEGVIVRVRVPFSARVSSPADHCDRYVSLPSDYSRRASPALIMPKRLGEPRRVGESDPIPTWFSERGRP